MTDHKALFSPTTLGPLKLKHRVIMAPLTRSRSIQPDSVPGDLMREYYDLTVDSSSRRQRTFP